MLEQLKAVLERNTIIERVWVWRSALCVLVGKSTLKLPVIAHGRSQVNDSGKSPKPLPKLISGETVAKSGAPRAWTLPVCPQPTLTPTSATA